MLHRVLQCANTRTLQKASLLIPAASMQLILKNQVTPLYAPKRHFRNMTSKQEEAAMREKEENIEKLIRQGYSPGLESSPKSTRAEASLKASSPEAETKKEASPDPPLKTSTPGAQEMKLKNIVLPSWLTWILLYYLMAFTWAQPMADKMSGTPWWIAAPELVATYMLCSLVLPQAKRRSIHKEFTMLRKHAPGESFIGFLADKYPNLLAGKTVSQREIIAALGACYIYAGNKDFIIKISTAARSASEPDAKIEAIMSCLKSAYPSVFGM